MNDATSKQHDALSATAAQQTVNVATMVLDTGQDQARPSNTKLGE